MNIYECEGGDHELRIQTFHKYFPNEEFQNYTPSFIDDENDIQPEELYDGYYHNKQ